MNIPCTFNCTQVHSHEAIKNSQCREGTSGCRPQRACIRCPRLMARYFANALQFGDPTWQVSATLYLPRPGVVSGDRWQVSNRCTTHVLTGQHLGFTQFDPSSREILRETCCHAGVARAYMHTCRVSCMMATLVVGAGCFGLKWLQDSMYAVLPLSLTNIVDCTNRIK